jgi:hypothetical protein
MIKRAVDESTRAVVSPDGLKLYLHDRDLNELYNFRDDPLERQNLYSDPRCFTTGRKIPTISSESKKGLIFPLGSLVSGF